MHSLNHGIQICDMKNYQCFVKMDSLRYNYNCMKRKKEKKTFLMFCSIVLLLYKLKKVL